MVILCKGPVDQPTLDFPELGHLRLVELLRTDGTKKPATVVLRSLAEENEAGEQPHVHAMHVHAWLRGLVCLEVGRSNVFCPACVLPLYDPHEGLPLLVLCFTFGSRVDP